MGTYRAGVVLAGGLLLGSCNAVDAYYADGGAYWTTPCSTAGRQLVASQATELLGGGTRDFSLLDRYGYRLRLTDFCNNSVLLVIGDMSDEASLAWLDELPTWLADRDPGAPPMVVITAWYSNLDGEVPTGGDLRRFAELVAEAQGSDPFTYSYDLSSNFDGGAFDSVQTVTEQVALIRDPYRYENAAPASSVMYVASDVPEEFRRSRRTHEVASRWGVRGAPYFVVLEPTLLIQAMGYDPVEDGIIDALLGVDG